VRVKIEKNLKKKFGYDVRIFLRTSAELHDVISDNPFIENDNSKLYVTFLSDIPSTIPTEAIRKVTGIGEDFSFSGRNIYLSCPNGYGKSKLSNNFFEKKLNQTATTRNWKTVQILMTMLRPRA
ncbi:MAG: DUF1697 domain-containing protein, partial [Chitinivibrionales bacterium]|nr:DUF1697 domain-containing protein [Chitinivibrionales bacterium]